MALKNLAAFKDAHDLATIIPAKLRAGLAHLAKTCGEEAAEYESDFLRRAKVPNSQIGPYREQFAKHIVETRGASKKRVWFASVKTAAAARATQEA